MFPNNLNKINLIFFIPFLWCVTGLLFYGDAPKDMVAIALVTMVTFLVTYGYKEAITNFKGSIISQLVAFFLCFIIAMDVYQGYSSTAIRAFSVSLVVLIFTPRIVIDKIRENLHLIIFVGSLSSFSFVVYEFYVLDTGRYWSINPVRYTTISCMLAMLSLMMLVLYENIKIRIISLISLLMSLNVLILGQTRGTLLAFVMSVMVFFLLLKVMGKLKIGYKFLTLLAIASLPFLYLNKQVIEIRYETTINEISNISAGNLDTSIGLRLQMWKSGLDMIKSSPFIGYGNSHFEEKKLQYKEGFISKQTAVFTHYHNQFIDSFVKLGVIGFLFLILVFSAPWYLYYKNKTSINLMMSIVSFAYIVASLTDVPLYHPQTIIVYFILMSIMDLDKELMANHNQESIQ